MRARLALLGILLLGLLLPGCTSKPEQKASTAVAPAPEKVETAAPEPLIGDDDAEIDALIQEVQELEDFLSDVESGEMLDTGI